MSQKKSEPSVGTLLQQFFIDYLMQQRHVSSRTIEAYRDSFKLLFTFAIQQLGKKPSMLTFGDLNANFILAFLNHLEQERNNEIRSRNARFAAIRSFMQYVSLKEPALLALTQAVLAIPMKRFDRPIIGFLSRNLVESLLAAPNSNTWSGKRDRVMFATLYNTGVRVSELVGMRISDFSQMSTAFIRVRGKGRKERCIPLWQSTANQIRSWLKCYPREPEQPLFPNRTGGEMTRTGVSERLRLAVNKAAKDFPELAKQRISPHVLRHSTAMHLLQSGVDITVIALWLGHENPATTHTYIEADLAMKEQALNALQPVKNTPLRFQPDDRLLKFLQGL